MWRARSGAELAYIDVDSMDAIERPRRAFTGPFGGDLKSNFQVFQDNKEDPPKKKTPLKENEKKMTPVFLVKSASPWHSFSSIVSQGMTILVELTNQKRSFYVMSLLKDVMPLRDSFLGFPEVQNHTSSKINILQDHYLFARFVTLHQCHSSLQHILLSL